MLVFQSSIYLYSLILFHHMLEGSLPSIRLSQNQYPFVNCPIGRVITSTIKFVHWAVRVTGLEPPSPWTHSSLAPSRRPLYACTKAASSTARRGWSTGVVPFSLPSQISRWTRWSSLDALLCLYPATLSPWSLVFSPPLPIPLPVSPSALSLSKGFKAFNRGSKTKHGYPLKRDIHLTK